MNSPTRHPRNDLFRVLFTEASDGMFVVNNAGHIIDANLTLCSQTSYEYETLCQLGFQDLFPDENLMLGETFQECQMHCKDGRLFPVNLKTNPLTDGRFLITVQNITLPEGTEQQVIRLESTIQTINDLAIRLNNLLTADDPLHYMATTIRDLSGVFAVTVSTYDPQTKELTVQQLETTGTRSSLLSRINDVIDRSLIGLRIPIEDAAYQQMCTHPVITSDSIHELTFGEIPQPIASLFNRVFSISKLYGLALVDNGELLGTIVIAMRKDAETLTESIRIMLSRICAVTLRRASYEQNLQSSEAKLRSYIDNAPLGIFIADENGRYQEVNATAAQMLGYDKEELLKLTIRDILAPDFLSSGLARFQKTLGTGKTVGETKLRRKDNSTFWAVVQAVRLEQNRGMAFVQDITARKKAEQSSQIKDELLRLTGEMAQVGGWEFDTETMAGTWTDEVARIHDLDPANETNVELGLSFYNGEDRQKIENAVQEAIEQARPYDLELELTTAKGNHKWIRTMGLPIVQDGKVVKVRGIFQDITEQRKAEETLREQIHLQHQLAQIATTVPGLICSFQLFPDGRVAMPYSTAALKGIYGFYPAEIAQDASPIFKIMHPEDVDHVKASIAESAKNMSPWHDKYRIEHPEKGERWIEGHSMPQKQSDGSILWHGFVQDITEQKLAEEAQAKLEAQLRQIQKMDSIGRLAGGVAHDFNNLLTVMQMYGDLMHNQMEKSDPLLPKLEQIQRATQRATELTRQLLAFSRKQILNSTVIDLNRLITNLEKMLGRLIGEDITLSTVLEPDLWPILADSGQIEQVILNLVVNARDAMPTGGMLTIETRKVYLDETIMSSKLNTPVGPCVLLAITDNGIGMDEATKQRVFEPFFTTKDSGKGTGLGLATVHGIIRQSEGTIFVYSEPGQGTTFKIYLPASKEGFEPKIAQPAPSTVDHSGSEIVLVVEDEEAVRSLVKMTLQELGYRVLEAEDGAAALALAARQEKIDLLLTDVVMPRMSGRELAEQLSEQSPALKVLFMSGYMDDAVVRHGILTAQVEFLPKPFSAVTLAAKVRTILNK